MLKRSIRALAAVLAGLVMSLSAPALSLAHGYVHHELGEHSTGLRQLTAEGHLLRVAVYTAAEDHGHPVIYSGPLFRFAPLVPALVAKQPMLDLGAGRMVGSGVPLVPVQSAPDPVSTRPQQPRAPPAL